MGQREGSGGVLPKATDPYRVLSVVVSQSINQGEAGFAAEVLQCFNGDVGYWTPGFREALDRAIADMSSLVPYAYEDGIKRRVPDWLTKRLKEESDNYDPEYSTYVRLKAKFDSK